MGPFSPPYLKLSGRRGFDYLVYIESLLGRRDVSSSICFNDEIDETPLPLQCLTALLGCFLQRLIA